MPSEEEIHKAYTEASDKAVKKHEDGVRAANAKLADTLAKAKPEEKPEILHDFDQKIAPVRDAYNAAVEQAAHLRDEALTKL